MSDRVRVTGARDVHRLEALGLGPPASIHRRRAEAARARRRRLLALDLGCGLALAAVALAIAPGLAIVGIAALIGLLACALSGGYAWMHRRRADHSERALGDLEQIELRLSESLRSRRDARRRTERQRGPQRPRGAPRR